MTMNSMDALTQPMAAACPLCGQPATLPRLSAEELLFRSPAVFPLAVALPDGSMALAVAGVIYAMPSEEWTRFQTMRSRADEQPFEAA
jgi:hypothetical protein